MSKKKVLLSGYYGFDNAGDEAVLFAIINSLRQLAGDNVEITVLSNNPEHTKQQYGVNAVDRWGKKAIYQAIKQCDLLISGGGSLLQDVTSKNGILYYLGIIYLAQKMKKQVVIYAQGIGPINEPRNRKLTAKLLNKVSGITVRDFASRQELMNMGVKKEILVAVDPVLGVDGDKIPSNVGKDILNSAGVVSDKPTLGISIRPWKTEQSNWKELAKACDRLHKEGWQLVFVPMHYPDDIEIAKEVVGYMEGQGVVLEGNYSPEETIAIYKEMDMILGMRLHALIMGAAVLKPLVAISYDPKIEAFAQSVGINDWMDVNGLDAERIVAMIFQVWEQKNQFVNELTWKMEIVRKQALAPAQMVLTIGDKKC